MYVSRLLSTIVVIRQAYDGGNEKPVFGAGLSPIGYVTF